MKHTLTTEQLRLIVDSIGNGSDWPKFTNDPLVNHAVDCILNPGEEPEYDKTYTEEIEASKKLNKRD